MSDEHELDLPFEEVPDGPIDQELAAFFCGGVIVRAAVLPTSKGPMPALVFDFKVVEGGEPLPSIALIQDPDQTKKFAALVQSAAHASIKAARRGK